MNSNFSMSDLDNLENQIREKMRELQKQLYMIKKMKQEKVKQESKQIMKVSLPWRTSADRNYYSTYSRTYTHTNQNGETESEMILKRDNNGERSGFHRRTKNGNVISQKRLTF